MVLRVGRGEPGFEEPHPPRPSAAPPEPPEPDEDLDGRLFDSSRYRAPERPSEGPGAAPGRNGGRGEITSFSRQSRRRLMTLFSAVPWRTFRPDRLVFCTLTYPGVYPANPRVWKQHLWAFRRRLEREYGELSIIWKMEFQRRGAAHFHLLIFAPDELIPARSSESQPFPFGESLVMAWHEIAGGGDANHLQHGVDVRQARSWRGAMAYLSKYLCKEQVVRHEQSIGRIWGVWRYRDLGVRWLRWNLEWTQFLKLRRVFRRVCKYRRGRGQLQQMICFLEFGEFLRVLEHVGALANPPPALRADRAEAVADLAGCLRAVASLRAA